MPLFNRAQGTIAASRARETVARELVRARRLDAGADIAQARARIDAARRAIAIYSTETRTLASRNLEVLRETHALGRATLFDVLNEQRRYLEFESSYADAAFELFNAATALAAATGDVR
jgi:cobalt-zinc-cadmium efflux system outer membrane protein